MLREQVKKLIRNAGCEIVTEHVVLGKLPTSVEKYLEENFGVRCEWFAPAQTTYISSPCDECVQ